MEKTLTLHNKQAVIIPFRDALEEDQEMSWIFFDGMKQKYSDSLKAILEYEGYVIVDRRNNLEVMGQKEEDLY